MRPVSKESLKTNGYLKLHRGLNGLLFAGKLEIKEFALFLIFVMNCDWDYRHKNFGKVCISNKMLSSVKGLYRSLIPKLKDALVKKGLIKINGTEYGIEIIEVCNFDKYQTDPKFGFNWLLKDIEKEEKTNTNNQLGRINTSRGV